MRGILDWSHHIKVDQADFLCVFTIFLPDDSLPLPAAARYILYPWVFHRMLAFAPQAVFLGALPMGLATITNATVLIAVPKARCLFCLCKTHWLVTSICKKIKFADRPPHNSWEWLPNFIQIVSSSKSSITWSTHFRDGILDVWLPTSRALHLHQDGASQRPSTNMTTSA